MADETQIDPNAPVTTPQQGPATTEPNANANKQDDPDAPGLYFEEVEVEGGEPLRFEGASPEEVRDKVLEWIKDKAKPQPATETTQTTTALTPQQPAPAVKKRKLSEDENFAIENEFKNGRPIQALEQYFEKTYGIPLEQVVEAAQMGRNVAVSAEREARELTGVAQFREKHPEYSGTPANRTTMELWLRANGKEATLPNLEEAYKSLSSAGLIKNEEAQPTTQPTTQQTPTTQPNTQATTPRRTASGLFGRQGAPSRRATATTTKSASDAEIDKAFKEGGSEGVLQKLLESPAA